MRFIRRRLVAIAIVAFIVICGEIALGNTIAKNQELIQPPIKITEAFKDIPYNPDSSQEKNIPGNPRTVQEQEINDFSWKTFIALNWPVDCEGKPLESTDPLSDRKYPKIIGQAPEAPRRWELYRSPKSVFLPNGTPPPSEPPEVKQCLNDRAGSEIEYNQNLRLTEAEEFVTAKESGEYKIASRKDLLDADGELESELTIDGKEVNISLSSIDAANKIPLVDRQGNYVINEIRLNPVEFNQIVENKWYDATNLVSLWRQNSDSEKLFQLVCSTGEKGKYCNTNEAEGAIEIKAAWRVFDERNNEQEKARYYTTKRKIVSKKGEILNEKAELGLIGFHIMHKTSSRGWIWSTFEHIDNASPCDGQKTKDYTLHNNECNTKNCQENEPYVKPPYLWDISNNEPKAVTIEVSQGIAVKDQIPSQICRTNKISKFATNLNKKYQNSLREIDESSVWQYYQLIGTQWLEDPDNPYSNFAEGETIRLRKIMPDSEGRKPLTNVALEPYAQGVSCIVCHTSAHLPIKDNICQLNGDPKNCADFSFLMDNAEFSQ
ncbi:hypothetical protein IQ264_27775 [Phormidium sp. LEGE 05292]|uniref:hypothetical protein n=1 Tax=[Phormidium] sp. LEGE 05292 TaxID=767427 RepID=UPI00187F4133|nr:hypothetical protein [Phormidium sp. LEGE 05292]MBE9229208.1 hypothetical protein [Phormidium sp. LEGE 05292]